MIDLHVHSCCSDGTDPPEKLVELAATAGCHCLALTDHDTVAGVSQARAAGKERDVEVIAGVELSAHIGTHSVHILGYFLDIENDQLLSFLDRQCQLRDTRNLILVEKLNDMGVGITIEEVHAQAMGKAIGRPHFAAALIQSGYAESVNDAFTRYLGPGAATHVDRRDLHAAEAVSAIRAAGGVAVWAHPLTGQLRERHEVEDVAASLVEVGLGGIESWYSRYLPDERKWLSKLAQRSGVVATGGSDYHGLFKPDISLGTGTGDLSVPDSVRAELESAI